MLTRLRKRPTRHTTTTVIMPHSKIKVHIAEILQQEGYIAGWQVQDAEVGKEPGGRAQVRGRPGSAPIAGLKRVFQGPGCGV